MKLVATVLALLVFQAPAAILASSWGLWQGLAVATGAWAVVVAAVALYVARHLEELGASAMNRYAQRNFPN